MKIAIFHLGFFYSGGGEKLVLEEMRGLRGLGYEVDCYAPYVDRSGCFPDVPEMAEIRSLLPPPPSWLPLKDVLWLTLACIFVPFMAWRFRNYDIFLAANQPAPWFAYVIGKILRKPYVIYLAQPLRLLHPRKVDMENGIRIREGDHRYLVAMAKFGGRIIGWADGLSVRNAAVMLTNGNYVNSWLKQVYGRAGRVCAAGCHPLPENDLTYADRWKGERIVNEVAIKKPYALITNRHAPQKRFEYALWVLKMIGNDVPDLSLVITGQETSYTDQLRYLAEGLRLEDKVHFVGLIPENELERLYQESALYIYPSPEEDFGMGIIEAMAAGTPVVAWNNCGPTGIVQNRVTGFLVEPYDTDEFADKVLRLATDPGLVERTGRAGHRLAKSQFAYARHHQAISNAIGDAMEGRAAGSEAEPSTSFHPSSPRLDGASRAYVPVSQAGDFSDLLEKAHRKLPVEEKPYRQMANLTSVQREEE